MNQTAVSHFVLLSFSERPGRQILLGIFFLSLYLVTVIGNLVIILLLCFDPKLQTPMYFFLGNLSFLDICFSSTTVPKLVANLLSTTKTISWKDCMAQLYCFFSIGNTESFVMAVMAFDRYVAICRPLHYTVIMSRETCFILLVLCWTLSFLHSLIYSLMASRLSFCGTNVLEHFFCDIPPILYITCSDTSAFKLVLYSEGSLVVGSSFVGIIVSYLYILKSILNISSSGHRRKLFSTCSSHLAVVWLFYGTDLFTYMGLSRRRGALYNQLVSVMYAVVAPLLNPFIYSLRNNDVKSAFQRVLLKAR
ncbi:olfactory receptor 1361-like [Spea bombifrons]|uniref:olfactory receptor 1361-like n=1 Tax=Spea bombifrons TaxID=233779 RepID=UPI0023498C73|nr:olfactory receptor 1361-like [Spea bombifrons]